MLAQQPTRSAIIIITWNLKTVSFHIGFRSISASLFSSPCFPQNPLPQSEPKPKGTHSNHHHRHHHHHHHCRAMKMVKNWGTFGFWCCILSIVICARVCSPGRSDKETRERFYGNMVNSSAPEANDATLAKMFDRVLEKEFSENDQPEGFSFF